MVNYVTYTHTDYLDVLEIEEHYTNNYGNRTLLINKSNIESEIYSKYNKVIFYDDTQPYATRLLSLSELDDKYILFHHETDIIINKNDAIVEDLILIMEEKGIDRIDLQWRDQNKWNPNTRKIDVHDFQISKQENIKDYIFNINPALWKLSTFLAVHTKYKNEKYKTIEWHNIEGGELSLQKHCKNLNFYKLWLSKPLHSGALICLYFFQYIHITKNGKWYPKNQTFRFSGNPQTYDEYNKIIKDFNLGKGKRKF
jgi:hypothetical protein